MSIGTAATIRTAIVAIARPRPTLPRRLRLIAPLLALTLAGCGARSEDVAKTSSGDGRRTNTSAVSPSKDEAKANVSDAGAANGTERDDAQRENTEANSANSAQAESDPTQTLAKKKAVDPSDSSLPLPQCAAPLEADFGYPTFGTEAVRLHWKPKTGECRFTSGDGTPEGWTGILTLRHHDDDLFLSGIGEWQYYAPHDLDLDALPPDETLTFYPYLGEWQFVIDIRYVDDTVTIERFQYIDGEPPENFGVPDQTSNEPVAGPMLVPCTSLSKGSEDAGSAAAEQEATP